MKETLSDLSRNAREDQDSSVTIKDVAKVAGVSIATVSRVLNNSPFVKEKNKIKVNRAVKDLGYKPNVFAQRLAGGKLNAVGLIIPGYEGVFYSFYAQEVIRNIGFGLESLKKDLFLHMYWNKDNFNSGYVEGVIFADIIRNEKQLKRIVDEEIPCVVINKTIEDLPVSFVAIDNKKGAEEAVKLLIDLGHRRIAHITGDLNAQCAQDRLSGFKSILNDSGIQIPDYFIQEGNFSRAQARRAVEFLSEQKVKPTAIFCACDDMAYEIILCLLEKKIKIPEDISIIGFDDNPQFTYGPVALTTVHQPLDEMVKQALAILQDHISGETRIPIHKVLPTKLILGDSTTYAPKS